VTVTDVIRKFTRPLLKLTIYYLQREQLYLAAFVVKHLPSWIHRVLKYVGETAIRGIITRGEILHRWVDREICSFWTGATDDKPRVRNAKILLHKLRTIFLVRNQC